jgi:serine/threonine-protein kinase
MQDVPKSVAGVREGDVLAGKYRVERILGIGGMGVVVAAHHVRLDEKVALKFLLPEALGNVEAVARFAREARAAVRIKSEHVARVIDVDTLPNGAPYMVMEYLEGGDLAAWLEQRGALPVEQAVEFVLQASVAVADAHALGIVHRDLKPANLFCVRRSDGQLSIKVLDFGISKMTDIGGSAPGSMTRTAALMGSPLYMSPEQMRSSKDVDAQTDIWALGVILFELMTGRPAFLGESVMELAIKVANEPTPSIRSFRPDVPVGLEAVVATCMEKDRRRRYRNVAELALALLPFAPKRARTSVERISGIIQAAGLSASSLAVPPSPKGPETQMSAGTMTPVGRTTAGPSGRKSAVFGGLGAAAVLVAVVCAGIFWKRASAHGEGTPATAILSASPVDLPVAASAPPAAPPAPPPPTVAAEPSATLPIAPLAKPVVLAKPATPPPRAFGGTPPRAQPPSPTPPPPPAVPSSAPPEHKPSCNPPYFIDSAGDRQYKPECL